MRARVHVAVLFTLWAAAGPARADAVTPSWYVLTGDGKLAVFMPAADGESGMRGALDLGRDVVARAFAVMPDRALVVLSGDKLLVSDGKHHKPVPGHWQDLEHLTAAGARLVGATKAGEIVEIALPGGKRTTLAKLDEVWFLTADGELPLVMHAGVIEELGPDSPRKTYPVVGRPLALAAADGHLFFAVREGQLFQIDRQSGRRRELGLGNWTATAAMFARGAHVFIATRAGKLWDVDYTAPAKHPVAMQGWETTLSLVPAPPTK